MNGHVATSKHLDERLRTYINAGWLPTTRISYSTQRIFCVKMSNTVTLLCSCLLLAGTAFVATNADHPPSNVRQVCSVSENTYLLQWDAPTEEERTVTSYTLQLSDGRTITTGNSQTELVVVGDRTSFPVNITGVETPFGFLTHFTSYSVRVSASYGSDSSDFSESGIFWTPPYFPSRLDAPTVDILGPSVLRLRWSPPTYVNGPDLRYTIRVIPDLGGPQIDAIVVRTTRTSVVLRDLCHATHIGASIIPSSGFTTEFTQGITPEVDMPPSNLAPTNVITSNNVSSTIEGRNMFVSWDPPMEDVDNDTRYVVEASCSTESTFDDGLPCENPPRLDTPNTSGVIIGLLPGRKYFIRVRALRNGELSAPACAVNTASVGAPPSPSLVSATVINSTSVSLDVQNGVDVVIVLHVRINGALRQFDAPIGPVILSGLTPQTDYQIEVAVQNFDGVGPYSEPITVNTRTNNDLLNVVQNVRLHFPRGSSVLSMYLSWEPPINAAGILEYYVYLNDEIFPVGLEQFYEFTVRPDTVYTASVCYDGASPCYRTSMLQFELTQDLVRSVNASAFALSGNYTVDLVPINSSAIFVFFSPPINNCNGVEHLSSSGFITDLGDIEPLIPVPPLAEGTQSYIQTGLNASTRYFFYSLRLRANYTKTVSGQRLTSARTMDGAPSGAPCAAEMVNGVSWPTTSRNQNSIVSFEREGCPVILMRFCSVDGQWRPVEEQLNPCGLSGAQLIPPPTDSASPTTATTTNPNSTGSSAIPSTSVAVLVTSLGACLLYIKAVIL